MKLNDKIRISFQENLNKSESEILERLDSKINNYDWTDLISVDGIDYREFRIKKGIIKILREPKFLAPFRPYGKILIKFDSNNETLNCEIHPYNKALPSILLTIGIILTLWTVGVLWTTMGINSLLMILFAYSGLSLFLLIRYYYDRSSLKRYAKKVIDEINRPAANTTQVKKAG